MKYILLLITLSFSAFNVSANSFGIIVDKGSKDDTQFSADMYQCEQLAGQVQKQQSNGAVKQGVKTGVAGAATGAAIGAISGGSGSSGAKTGAAVGVGLGVLGGRSQKRAAKRNLANEQKSVMRNCLIGRGYSPLN